VRPRCSEQGQRNQRVSRGRFLSFHDDSFWVDVIGRRRKVFLQAAIHGADSYVRTSGGSFLPPEDHISELLMSN
jgi:hypothetical protein